MILTDKTQLQCERRFFLLGQGRPEIVQCKQVKIEHTATLITLLADREVQLRPWEGNYSHNVWKADKRDRKRERKEWGRKRRRRREKNERCTSDSTQRRGKQDKDRVILTLASSDGQNDSRKDRRAGWGSSHILYKQVTRHTYSNETAKDMETDSAACRWSGVSDKGF